MVRKHQKFQNFLKKKNHKASTKPTTNNCNHSKLLKEINPEEVQNQHAQINYKSTHDNKCETTRAKNTIKRKSDTIKLSRKDAAKQQNVRRRSIQRTGQETVGKI